MCYIDIVDVMHELITQFSIIGNNKYKNSFNHSKSSVKWEARTAETSKRFCSLPPERASDCSSHLAAHRPVVDTQADLFYSLSLALQPSAGYGLLVTRGFVIIHNDAPQSLGLLLTNDKLVAATCT
jgi:hypothetical protein